MFKSRFPNRVPPGHADAFVTPDAPPRQQSRARAMSLATPATAQQNMQFQELRRPKRETPRAADVAPGNARTNDFRAVPADKPVRARRASESAGHGMPYGAGGPIHRTVSQSSVFLPSQKAKASGSTLTLARDADLGDALPFLTREASSKSKLTGGRNKDGMWLDWTRFTFGKHESLHEAREVLKDLVLNIQEPRRVKRPFIETRTLDNGSRTSLGLAGFDRAVEQCLKDIDAVETLDAESVRRVLQPVSERMHRAAAKELPSTRADTSEAARPPYDCLAHWMDALDTQYGALAGSTNRRERIRRIETEARDIWLSHDMTAPDLASYFRGQVDRCNKGGLPTLGALAGKLSRELSRAAATGTLPQQYDSQMARAWESALIRELVKSPPPKVAAAANDLAEAQRARLTSLARANPVAWEKVAGAVQLKMRGDDRFWTAKVSRLSKFVKASADERGDKLLHYLNKMLESGEDCISIHYATVKISAALKQHAPDYIGWDKTAQDAKEFRQRDAARAIVKKPGHIGQGSGILLAHQAPMPDDPYASHFWPRPSTTNRPNINAPSVAVKTSLPSGAPYGSGPSGSVAFVAKAVDYMNRYEHARIDPAHAMLGALMFVVFDGGHSIHEVMWALNQIKPRIDMAIGGKPVPPDRYVGNYNALFNSFHGDTARILRAAVATAFDAVNRYRRKLAVEAG